MARLRGTGKDPANRYTKDVIFDVPKPSPEYESLVAMGWAEDVPPEEDPGRTRRQIAEALVRGDALTHPVEQEIAKSIEDPYAEVHDVPDSAEAVGDEESGAGSAGNPLTDPGSRASDDAVGLSDEQREAGEKERGSRRRSTT